MKSLSKSEIQQIKSFLIQNAGLSKTNISELLDHFCSKVENEMNDGEKFQETFERIKTGFNFEKFNALDKELKFIHFSKFINMKFIIVLLLVSTTVLPFYMNNQSNSGLPSATAGISEVLDHIMDPPSLWPVKNAREVSSSFGMRMHPIFKEKRHHRGIDIPAKKGSEVLASAAGEVIKAEYHKNYGYHIILKHDDQYSTLYAQLFKLHVEEGQIVKKGELIGEVGSSGKSTAPHLHFEVIENGHRKDPLKYIKV